MANTRHHQEAEVSVTFFRFHKCTVTYKEGSRKRATCNQTPSINKYYHTWYIMVILYSSRLIQINYRDEVWWKKRYYLFEKKKTRLGTTIIEHVWRFRHTKKHTYFLKAVRKVVGMNNTFIYHHSTDIELCYPTFIMAG